MCQMLGVFLFKNKRGCSNLFEYLTIPSGICSPLSTLTKLLQEGIPQGQSQDIGKMFRIQDFIDHDALGTIKPISWD